MVMITKMIKFYWKEYFCYNWVALHKKMNEIYKKRLILYRQIQLEKLNINEEK